ncbi:putative quinol monooxygenase [Lysobacter arvi]|uniref:Antibiotic biosynthesis monooxygenase n=1 Tax=Lysobacter arvi TaxID=3038776 RepID=A0ABU1CEF1_9GAMM|nr:antibiotic biosynthesis monooxygenase [Lysobacter arvi]MDR0183287.1 antibiotic biosynthesis monooxygenase [Lysobacter arvi]
MANDDLVFYVKLYVKPECVDEWRRAFDAIVQAMSQEPEFVACYAHRDANDPNQFTLYERWAESSVESFLRNQMKPYRVEYDAAIQPMLQRPREPQVLLPIGAWFGSHG